VVTRAAHGATTVTADGVLQHPPYRVTAVDSTAAGDAFAGHLGAALAADLPWDHAVSRAMAAGALAATVAGASPSLPTAAAVDDLQRRQSAPAAGSLDADGTMS
jgi:ribokinase